MPVPVSVVSTGGIPVINTALGVPMTPVTAPVYGVPVVIVTEGTNVRGLPVHLVNDDLTDWSPLGPELLDPLDFTSGWTAVGTASADGPMTFSAAGTSGEGFHEDVFTPGKTYLVEVTYTKSAGSSTLSLTNSTSSARLIASSASNAATLSATMLMTDSKLYFRLSGAADTVVITSASAREVL